MHNKTQPPSNAYIQLRYLKSHRNSILPLFLATPLPLFTSHCPSSPPSLPNYLPASPPRCNLSSLSMHPLLRHTLIACLVSWLLHVSFLPLQSSKQLPASHAASRHRSRRQLSASKPHRRGKTHPQLRIYSRSAIRSSTETSNYLQRASAY